MVTFFEKLFVKKDLIDEQLSCIENLEKKLEETQEKLNRIVGTEYETRRELDTARAVNRGLARVMFKNNIAPQQIYEAIDLSYDRGGFELYNMALNLIHVSDVSIYDTLGYFENESGFGMLWFLELLAFGGRALAREPYERFVECTIHTDNDEYKQYRDSDEYKQYQHTLYEKTVKKILHFNKFDYLELF